MRPIRSISVTEIFFQLYQKSNHHSKTYFEYFFKNNLDNLINTWKGIQNLINNNNSTDSSIHLLANNDDIITDPIHIANRPGNIVRRCHPEREKLDSVFLLAITSLSMR